ncbi:Yip1-domain-containing protein [Clavulina sp. PMI_390]|nr:Yip1-domain-containing protein [Clavulina sp. PMI_390]
MMESTTTPHNAQFIQADDDDDLDESSIPSFQGASLPAPVTSPNASANAKGKGRADTLPVDPNVGRSSSPMLSGTIGSGGSGAAGASGSRKTVGGVKVETRYTGADTLDEPVLTTISRDLLSIYTKLIQVLWPRRTGAGREVLRDWDLWGPLILCLALGIMLSVNAPPTQALGVFTGVVVIVSLGSLVVTLNAKLLGGRVSFFQSLCVLGYCIFPLVLAALVAMFVRILWVRAPVAIGAWAWAMWAAMNFFDGTKIEEQRVLLAVYPIFLFYFILAWMILIQ